MTAKRIAIGLPLLAVLVTAGAWPGRAQRAHTVTVQLLAINDLHGNLEPPAGEDGLVNQVPAGGAEYLATHIRNAVRENPNSILVGAGDLIGASPLISGLFLDGPTINALNAMNLAITSIGNHELDHGPAELLRRVRGGCLSETGCSDGEKSEAAHFQYLAANVVRATGAKGPILPATAVRAVGGVKIGFIGETLQATAQLIPAASAEGLQFLEESSVANEAAARLEREGVHAIVLLIHQGGRQRPANGTADPNGCENFEGDLSALVNKLSPSIKLVISAHTHQFYNCEIAGHTVTSAGSFGRLFTRMNLTVNRDTGAIVILSAKNIVVTRDVPKDPVQTAILERFRPGMARVANRIVGSVSGEIGHVANEAGESALGDVIADAQLASVSAPDKGGAVMAFINEGGIRASIPGPAGPNGPRQVSFGDLYKLLPFANQVTVLTMTGDMIRRLLEQQFSAEGSPYILQVSDGFTYRYKLHARAGQHVVTGSLALHGRPIALADRVRVEANDFLSAGGEGFTVFREGIDRYVGPIDIDSLVEYFGAHSPVAPGPQNRIMRVD